jgi:hypothetical protein
MAEPEKMTADRLILVSDVHWLRLEHPVFIQPGERYWIDFDESRFFVEDQDGRCRSFPARRNGLR